MTSKGASKSVCIYLPDDIQKELSEMQAHDGVHNTSQYLKRLIHLTYLVGGVRDLEKSLISLNK